MALEVSTVKRSLHVPVNVHLRMICQQYTAAQCDSLSGNAEAYKKFPSRVSLQQGRARRDVRGDITTGQQAIALTTAQQYLPVHEERFGMMDHRQRKLVGGETMKESPGREHAKQHSMVAAVIVFI